MNGIGVCHQPLLWYATPQTGIGSNTRCRGVTGQQHLP